MQCIINTIPPTLPFPQSRIVGNMFCILLQSPLLDLWTLCNLTKGSGQRSHNLLELLPACHGCSLTYLWIQRSLTWWGMERKAAFTHGEGPYRIQVNCLSLESGILNVQMLALLDKLASLSYSRGNKFGYMVRRHN